MSSTAKICTPPQNSDECDVCHYCQDDFEDDERPGEWKLFKCSVCRNRFYCSTACQKKDWKKHKVNCTKLPTGPIELPTITIPLEELEKEAAKAEEALKNAYKEIKAAEDANGKKPIGAARVKKLEGVKSLAAYALPEAITWPNPHSIPPLPHLLASISRLFLLLHVAQARQKTTTDEEFAASLEGLETYFDSFEIPQGWTVLAGTKVMRMPGELGLAEYFMLPQCILPYVSLTMGDKEQGERWSVLAVVLKKLQLC